MKKKLSKILITGIILTLALSTVAFLTGCGGSQTLENYVNDNEEAKKGLESIKDLSNDQLGIMAEVKENNIIYTLKFKTTLKGDALDQVKDYYDKSLDTIAPDFQKRAKALEKESEIDGITLTIKVLNGDDTQIASKDYEAAE